MNTILYTISIFLFLAFASSYAYSCSCAAPTQTEAFKASESIFIGKFVRRTDPKSESSIESKIELKIKKSWKGAKAGKIISLQFFELAGCNYDIEFVRGEKYLIYAYRTASDRILRFDVDCGRSRALKDSGDDIKNMKKVAKSN